MAPMVSAGPDIVVGSIAPVSLLATVTEDPNASPTATIAWTQTSGPAVTLFGADTLTPSFVAPAVAFGGAQISLAFQITATDQFGSSIATVNVTVVGATDLLTATATWRAPVVGKGNRVGQKGGKLTVTATSSVISPSVDLTVAGFGGMTNLGAGNYTLNATGVTLPPDTVTVRSTLGGQVIVPVTVR
jgi:hypothetical protein